MNIQSISRRRPSGFTLIELLIVITIIAILAGIAFPVYNKVFGQAESTQAQKDCTDIASAVNQFFNDTHKYPLDDQAAGEDANERTDDAFLKHMRGEDDTVNRKETVYFDGNEGKGDRGGRVRAGEGFEYRDPWAEMYYLTMDTNRDKWVENPFEQGERKYTRAIVYSFGPDKDRETEDDNVKSW